MNQFSGAERGLIHPKGETNCEPENKTFVVLSVVPKRAFTEPKTFKLNIKNVPFTDDIVLTPPNLDDIEQIPQPILPTEDITPVGSYFFATGDAGGT